MRGCRNLRSPRPSSRWTKRWQSERKGHGDARRAIGILLCACLASIGGLSGCGNDTPSGGSDKAAAPAASKATKGPQVTTFDASTKPRNARITIALKDKAFKPQYLTARQGQTLVFVNEDIVAHKLKGNFGWVGTSKTLKKGDTFELKIVDSSNLGYVCTIHPKTVFGGVSTTK